jgi:hypothetical protein
VDSGLLCLEPSQPYSHQVQEALRCVFLRDTRPADLLLHSAQGPPHSWRYVGTPALHKTSLTPPAYTIYAFFEWSLVLLDVAFDAVTMIEFANFEIVVKDVRGLSRGYVPRLPL